MSKRYFFFIFVVMPLLSFCQFKKIKRIELADTVMSVAIDRPGDLYVIDTKAKLQKFDKDGNLTLSEKTDSRFNLFEPRDGARLFAFDRLARQCAFLSPTLEPINLQPIDSAFVITPSMACSSGEFNIWVVDEADQSLKKINVRSKRIEIDVKLSTNLNANDILFMREYQGFLFILSKKSSIQILNSMGKVVKSITSKKISYFNFLGEELYYLQDNKLKFWDLFTSETREINLPSPCRYALLTDERLYLAQDRSIEIFEVTNK